MVRQTNKVSKMLQVIQTITLFATGIFTVNICMFLLHIYPPTTRKHHSAITSLHWSCQPPVYLSIMGESCQAPFPTALQMNLSACR